MGPDLARAYFWPAVNKRLTCLWPGHFLTRPEEIFSKSKTKPKMADLARPDSSNKKFMGPDLDQKFLTRTHQYGMYVTCVDISKTQHDIYIFISSMNWGFLWSFPGLRSIESVTKGLQSMLYSWEPLEKFQDSPWKRWHGKIWLWKSSDDELDAWLGDTPAKELFTSSLCFLELRVRIFINNKWSNDLASINVYTSFAQLYY